MVSLLILWIVTPPDTSSEIFGSNHFRELHVKQCSVKSLEKSMVNENASTWNVNLLFFISLVVSPVWLEAILIQIIGRYEMKKFHIFHL